MVSPPPWLPYGEDVLPPSAEAPDGLNAHIPIIIFTLKNPSNSSHIVKCNFHTLLTKMMQLQSPQVKHTKASPNVRPT